MRRLFVLLWELALVGAAHASEPAPYVVAYSENHPFAHGLVTFLTEAYGRIGQTIQTRPYPPARSVELADRGEVDAEAARVPDAMDDKMNLIAVPEPIDHRGAYAFTTGPVVDVPDWSALRPFHICVLVGDLIAMRRTAGFQRETAHDLPSEFRMLKSGRCAIAIADEAAWLEIDKEHLGPLRMMETPIQTFAVYHYVYRSHAQLVPALAKAFRAMNEEGFTQALQAPYLQKVREARARNTVPLFP